MKKYIKISGIILLTMVLLSCGRQNESPELRIIFLHHSTGRMIWNGKPASGLERMVRNKSNRLARWLGMKAELPVLFDRYNRDNRKNYIITEKVFPKGEPYGWSNFPYDYYNIWVKNAGEDPYLEEPTLEMLTKDYQVIIFKHCFPVSNIQPDKDSADINSDHKTLSNYRLQYEALREKIHGFPDTKFILFTGAVQVKSAISEDEAARAGEFFRWVREEWDTPGDNIYLWDLYSLETEGGNYLKDEYATSATDSHPNEDFAEKAVKLLFNRIIDIIENNGQKTTLSGKAPE